MSRPPAASRKLLKTPPSGKEITSLLNGLKDMNDRTVAIMGTAILQNLFERFLQSRMRQLSKEDLNRIFDASQNGFLSSFSAQIRLAYALEYITDSQYADLLLINDIRNVFAHSLHDITFNHPSLAQDCGKFTVRAPEHTFSEENKKRWPFVYFVNAIFFYSICFNFLKLQNTKKREAVQDSVRQF